MEELKERVKEILATQGILNEEQSEREIAELLEGATPTDVATLIVEAYNRGINVYYDSWKKQGKEIDELRATIEKVKERVFIDFLTYQTT
jgi:polyhydroxyalkanoate synthesis regulator phasin